MSKNLPNKNISSKRYIVHRKTVRVKSLNPKSKFVGLIEFMSDLRLDIETRSQIGE